jgi:hypothetical protein
MRTCENAVEPERSHTITTRRMRVACSMTKATNTHSDQVLLIAFARNNCYTIAPQCHVMRIFPVLLSVL